MIGARYAMLRTKSSLALYIAIGNLISVLKILKGDERW